MMKLHQGVDVVDILKFRNVSLKNKSFIEEIFTEGEKKYCLSKRDPYLHFAGRFAAKEACLKALGWGLFAMGIDHVLQDIEISHHISGRPEIAVHGWMAKIANRRGIEQYTVSISHSSHVAIAVVVLVGIKQ